MATFEMMECDGAPPGERKCKSAVPYGTDGLTLRRNRANNSMHLLTLPDCQAKGVGYSWSETNAGLGNCYYPCPPSYRIDDHNVGLCMARPLLTSIDIYYEVMRDATRSCADKSAAYQAAILESGKDPATIPFPPECPNPYAKDPTQQPATTGSDGGVYDPAASNGDPLKPQDAPPIDSNAPYIPPPPATYKDYDPIASDTSPPNPNLPTSRITLTDEEIDQFPKVNDYGTMRDDSIAQRSRINPTFVDSNPQYISDCDKYIKDFIWSCIPTQDEFDKLSIDLQCMLVSNYSSIYSNPRVITQMRSYAPSITLTRDAPPATPPIYSNTPKEKNQKQCEGKKGGDGNACEFTDDGSCAGKCVCHEAPEELTFAKASDNTILILGILLGGTVVIGGGLWYGYKYFTPTGRAMSMAQNFSSPDLSKISIGGFKLVSS
jgi:hypothetical protein